MSISKRKPIIAITVFCLITLLYLAAVFLTFGFPRTARFGVAEFFAFALTLLGGLGALGVGYVSVVYLGGKASLGIADFLSKIGGSQQIIEVEQEAKPKRIGPINDAAFIYIPAIIFITTLLLALNIHYLVNTFTVTFQVAPSPILQTVLSTLDIFSKPTSIGSLGFSIEIIPLMVLYVVLSGIPPAIVLPYLRKFKITSINGVQFHKSILLVALGALLGVTIILSLANIIYGLIIGTQPHYYSYLLPAITGLSLHYSLGAFIGRVKAETTVENILKTAPLRNVYQGKITIQKESPRRV
jgi:hypothetical protein